MKSDFNTFLISLDASIGFFLAEYHCTYDEEVFLKSLSTIVYQRICIIDEKAQNSDSCGDSPIDVEDSNR